MYTGGCSFCLWTMQLQNGSKTNSKQHNSSFKFPFRFQVYYSCELAEQTALLSQLSEAKDWIKNKNIMSQKEEWTTSNKSNRQGLLHRRLVSTESLHHGHESVGTITNHS